MQSRKFPSAEYALITELQSILGEIRSDFYPKGIGDDAAVRRDGNGNQIVLTTDLSVENVHFSLSYMNMSEVGYRAMVTNLSDCAAMGAQPDSALVQLVVPDSGENERIDQIRELYHGLKEACRQWNFPIVGGDLSLGAQWVVGITLLGRVGKEKQVLFREGAQPGDGLWVSGVPGRSAAGLDVLRKWGRSGVPDRFRALAEAHIRPVPRVALGSFLAEDAAVHAMMDCSDGLSKDCRTMSYESRCGIILSFDSSQVPPAMI
ncbi:MAG: thiamine-phosphate kinase, partial [Chitinispirillaceae bacterium]|nr:thiamine-phosphate kinase [Chitinispirillaceae bacterium]